MKIIRPSFILIMIFTVVMLGVVTENASSGEEKSFDFASTILWIILSTKAGDSSV